MKRYFVFILFTLLFIVTDVSAATDKKFVFESSYGKRYTTNADWQNVNSEIFVNQNDVYVIDVYEKPAYGQLEDYNYYEGIENYIFRSFEDESTIPDDEIFSAAPWEQDFFGVYFFGNDFVMHEYKEVYSDKTGVVGSLDIFKIGKYDLSYNLIASQDIKTPLYCDGYIKNVTKSEDNYYVLVDSCEGEYDKKVEAYPRLNIIYKISNDFEIMEEIDNSALNIKKYFPEKTEVLSYEENKLKYIVDGYEIFTKTIDGYVKLENPKKVNDYIMVSAVKDNYVYNSIYNYKSDLLVFDLVGNYVQTLSEGYDYLDYSFVDSKLHVSSYYVDGICQLKGYQYYEGVYPILYNSGCNSWWENRVYSLQNKETVLDENDKFDNPETGSNDIILIVFILLGISTVYSICKSGFLKNE